MSVKTRAQPVFRLIAAASLSGAFKIGRMPKRDSLSKAWLAAEQAAAAAEREVANLQSPTEAELDLLVESARSLRRDADELFRQVYAAVKEEERP